MAFEMIDPQAGIDENPFMARKDLPNYQESRSDLRYASAPCQSSLCNPAVFFENFFGFGMITTRSDLHRTSSSSPADKDKLSRASWGMTI
jgi:hypothetical protein